MSHLHIRPSHSPPFTPSIFLSSCLSSSPLLHTPHLTPLSPLFSLPSSLLSPLLSPPHPTLTPLTPPFLPLLLPSLHPYRAESLREDSEVKSIFGGQLRSKIVCPDCAKVTVYFEYFRSVSNNTLSSFDDTLLSFLRIINNTILTF